MSARKYLPLGLAVGFGIFNGYYVFSPALKEEKQRRDGTYLSSTIEPLDSTGQPRAPSKDKLVSDDNMPSK